MAHQLPEVSYRVAHPTVLDAESAASHAIASGGFPGQVGLLYLEVQNEQEGSKACQDVQTGDEDAAGKMAPQQIVPWENGGSVGHRQAPVILVGAGLHLLALGLLDVEKAQTAHGADAEEAEDGNARRGVAILKTYKKN